MIRTRGAFESRRGRFTISTDRRGLDVDAIHAFLTRSYWARGIPRAVVARSIRHSLCFGVHDGRRQIGFARVITDRATYAYLADVYLLPAYRGRGLGRWLLVCIMRHPQLQGLRRWALVTKDAHGLYRPFGFAVVRDRRHMEILRRDVYAPSSGR